MKSNVLKSDFRAITAWFAVMIAGVLLAATPVQAKNPYARPDNTWISISGTVDSVSPDSFVLDYGEGSIVVEMDDGDRDADGYKLLTGDEVTVNGMIDDDFYERTTIEASSVYVEKLGTTFFASALDEEDYWVTTITTPVILTSTEIQGTVTSVSDEEFTLNTGLRSLTVEVDDMFYNPLDNEGYQKIEVGDFVKVTGTMDDDLFEGREFKAETIVELID